ncbi:uncharacterized protein G2W53_022775 [Senna tora]|uniref:Uncharacterized protein n=1 Tax=Senna tora TaxID=362788 RepID=A0A834WMF7_9FABA|nr:uncharacterized protein G2W53_022775 [Senna tora]
MGGLRVYIGVPEGVKVGVIDVLGTIEAIINGTMLSESEQYQTVTCPYSMHWTRRCSDRRLVGTVRPT